MEKGYDISVIMPVYNAEKFLASSLGNLLNQTKDNMQIILVNDASKDGSLRIMNDARNAFGDRVVVVDLEENKGPGAARNKGLEIAGGEYIGFVDSDDMVDVTMYEKLFEKAKSEDADICDCAFLKDSSGQASVHFSEELTRELDNKKRSTLISCGGYIWSKIFKKSLLDENNIRFRPVYLLEDADFILKTLICAKKVTGIPEVLYRYRDNEGSLTSETRLLEYTRVQFEAMEAVYNAALEFEDYAGIQDAVEFMILAMYNNIVNKLRMDKQNEDIKVRREIFDRARELRFSYVKKKPKNNIFARKKLNKNDLRAIEMADKEPEKILC